MEWTWPDKNPGFMPVKIDWDFVPCFSLWQVEEYGQPDIWGVWIYRVIETRDDQKYVMDWQMEIEAKRKCRPIHRYDRVERFKNVLWSLLGYKGEFGNDVLEMCRGISNNPETVWNEIRRILKTKKLKKLYNQIPSILRKLGWEMFRCEWGLLQEIMQKFLDMSRRFDLMEKNDRCYFMNLRYVALRLLIEKGVKFGYHVPLLQTGRKLVLMEKLWGEINL